MDGGPGLTEDDIDELVEVCIQQVITPALVAGTTFAAGALEWAVNTGNAVATTLAAAALTLQALLAVSLPLICAWHMVENGKWSSFKAFLFLVGTGIIWAGAALGLRRSSSRSIALEAHKVAQRIPQLGWLKECLRYTKCAFIVVVGIAVALFIGAGWWLYECWTGGV